MQRRIPLNEDGFTLIEVMISLFVGAVALLAYISSNIAVDNAAQQSFEKTMALQDAQRVIEQIRNTAQTGQFPDNVTNVFPNATNLDGFNNLSNEQVVVSYADQTTNPLDITVTVSWEANGRRDMDASLRTIVTQRGTPTQT